MVRAKSVVAAILVAVVLPTLLETARTTAGEKIVRYKEVGRLKSGSQSAPGT
jgi:hypothetical protein